MVKLECSTLVLDLDGTISDPSTGIYRCANYALEMHGLPVVSENAVRKQIGPPLDEMFISLAPGLDVSKIPQLVSSYRERYSEVGYSENRLYLGIVPALNKFKRKGMRLGVCTSKRCDFAKRIVSMFDIQEHFEFVDGGDIGVTKQAQLAALLSSGAIDGDAIMVGDRAVDIQSASKNGLRSIGVLWGFGSREELAEAEPTMIVQTIDEFSNISTWLASVGWGQ